MKITQKLVLLVLVIASVFVLTVRVNAQSYSSGAPVRELTTGGEIHQFNRLINILVRKEIEEERRLLKIMNDAYALVLSLRMKLERFRKILEILILELSIVVELEKLVPELRDEETETNVLQLVRGLLKPRVEKDKAITEEIIRILVILLKKAEEEYAIAKVNYFKDRDMRMKRLNAADEAKLRGEILSVEKEHMVTQFLSKKLSASGNIISMRCPACDNIIGYQCPTKSSRPVSVIEPDTGCRACECQPENNHVVYNSTMIQLTYSTLPPSDVPLIDEQIGKPVDWVRPAN